ncbi:hypothetical protein C4565_06520 [Candidatus Parcubacteria bacterium]|jgi:hypothetical protein|nr:MAG: hypothetical protein C4565_06520 [Candidatus Parcubacteria bacterium]
MRQTDLNISELILIATRRVVSPYPFCLIVNEIGEIFSDSEEENVPVAEATLISLLNDSSVDAQKIALSYLLIKEPSEQSRDIIKKYITQYPGRAAEVRHMIIQNGSEPWLTF